jgi:cytoskeleton protein RodZ
MSERDLTSDTSASPSDSVQAGPTGGAMLKAAREAAGLHIGALAVTLKVPVKKLEALEADRMDLLPDAVFVRALAASVCRTLRIDAAPVLARLPVTVAPRLKTVEAGINAPFRVPGGDPAVSIRERIGSPLAMAVTAMLLGAAILLISPPLDRIEQWLGLAQSDASSQTAVAPLAPAPAAVAPAPVEVKPSAIAAPVGVQDPIVSAAAPTTASAPLEPSLPVPAAVPPPPVRDLTGSLVLRARGASWVEVTDAAGVVQLRKMLSAGEGVGVSGKRPLMVVVGRADLVDVTVSGKPYDLVNVSRDKVARFEVK